MVAAAILREHRVLACRRTRPPAAAGRWELPGGKVEDGEDAAAALVREVAEELGLAVEVRAWLDGAVPIGATGYELRAAVAAPRDPGAEPDPREHDRVRWLSADELGDVDWLEPDRPFLPQLRAVLGGAGTATGIVEG